MLEIKNLKKSFDGRQILNGVDLTVEASWDHLGPGKRPSCVVLPGWKLPTAENF